MNYLKMYINICKKAKSRNNKYFKNLYYEKHHIFPVSIFGNNFTVIKVLPKEHYILHYLLTKIYIKRYGEKDRKTIAMLRAFNMFSYMNKIYKRHILSKHYSNMKIMNSEFNSILMSGTNNPFYGKTHSLASLQKIKEANVRTKKLRSENFAAKNNPMFNVKGDKHPRFGKKMSKESKMKISIANRGKLAGEKNPSKRDDIRLKISKNRKGISPFKRNNHPRMKINEEQKQEILRMWIIEKDNISGYKFCKNTSSKYNVTPAAIGNIIYKG